MYSENKWKRNFIFTRFCNNWEKFYYQSNNTGENENNKEILKKFNLL